MKNVRGTESWEGKQNFGPPGCDRTERRGGRYHDKHGLPVKAFPQKRACLPRTGSALATSGLRGTGATIACRRPEPVHACVDIVRHCMPYIQRNQEHTLRRETELRSGHSMSQEGIEIVRLRPGCVALPEAILRCPGQIGMPILPLVFDTIPELGATKIRDTCLYPFLLPRERVGTLAAVVTFSPFWAGKFHRPAKNRARVCYCSPSPRRLHENTKQRIYIYKREGSKNEERARDGILGGKTKLRTARGVTGRSGEKADTTTNTGCP